MEQHWALTQENILQPSNNILQPSNNAGQYDLFGTSSSATGRPAATAANVPVGSTWTNSGKIAIDLDNLLSGNSKLSGPAPSMNQLKTQSPVKTTANATVPPPFQANLIGAPAASGLSPKPQYSNIPTHHQAQSASSTASQQMPMFGNLVSASNQINLNNQFNAFQ